MVVTIHLRIKRKIYMQLFHLSFFFALFCSFLVFIMLLLEGILVVREVMGEGSIEIYDQMDRGN